MRQLLILFLFFTISPLFIYSQKNAISEEVLELNESGKSNLRTNPIKARSIFWEAYDLSVSKKDVLGKVESLKNIGTSFYYLGQNDSTYYYWNMALENTPDNAKKEKADMNNNLGAFYLRTGNIKSSLKHHKNSLELRKQIKDSSGIAQSYHNIAIIYRQKGDFDKALDHYLKALKLYEKLDMTKEECDALNGLGLIYLDVRNYELADKNFKKALSVAQASKNEIQRILVINNLGALYFKQKQYEKAESYFKEFLNSPYSKNDIRNRAGVHTNIATILSRKNEKEEAIKNYLEAYHIFKQLKDKESLTKVTINTGLLFNDIKKYNLAIQFLKEGEILAKEGGYKSLLKDVFHGLAEAYELSEKFKPAYDYSLKYSKIKDSLFSDELSENIALYQEKYQHEKNARKIEKLNHQVKIQEKENLIQKSFQNWLIISSSLAVLILLLFVNRLRLKRKVITQENRLLTEKGEKLKLESELKDKELEGKSKELSFVTMNLVHKNELLQDLSNQLTSKNNGGNEELLYNLKKHIESGLDMNTDWENFLIHFNGVHPNFFKKLNEKFPSLTRNDHRNCAYIRMGLSDKEIAVLMNISPKSVKMNRYRLKKKLSLQDGEDIYTFLIGL